MHCIAKPLSSAAEGPLNLGVELFTVLLIS